MCDERCWQNDAPCFGMVARTSNAFHEYKVKFMKREQNRTDDARPAIILLLFYTRCMTTRSPNRAEDITLFAASGKSQASQSGSRGPPEHKGGDCG